MVVHTVEGEVPDQSGDGGAALGHLCDDGADVGMVVELRSWDDRDIPDAERHSVFRTLVGRRIRVTIEVL